MDVTISSNYLSYLSALGGAQSANPIFIQTMANVVVR